MKIKIVIKIYLLFNLLHFSFLEGWVKKYIFSSMTLFLLLSDWGMIID